MCQHHTAAPIGFLTDIAVHPHNEARNDAIGQEIVVILESQTLCFWPIQVRFFFGQQVGNQKFIDTFVGKAKTQLKVPTGLFRAGSVLVLQIIAIDTICSAKRCYEHTIYSIVINHHFYLPQKV